MRPHYVRSRRATRLPSTLDWALRAEFAWRMGGGEAFVSLLWGALMLLAVAGIVIAQCGCAPRPQVVEPDHAPVPWCFAAVARFDGADQAAIGCFASPGLCANAQRRAVRWGGVAGLKEVGACQRR